MPAVARAPGRTRNLIAVAFLALAALVAVSPAPAGATRWMPPGSVASASSSPDPAEEGAAGSARARRAGSAAGGPCLPGGYGGSEADDIASYPFLFPGDDPRAREPAR